MVMMIIMKKKKKMENEINLLVFLRLALGNWFHRTKTLVSISILFFSSPQSEDCLYINVHAPTKSSQNGTLPVMVWIHGGGYRNGQGAPYDGSRLATRDVIVVTFNYRLDALGFLSTEDSAMPGNYGMLDMVAALKWVNANIASFGGNPQRVTIFGESAGSSSVSLLQLSPLAKGLFQGAIMQSGVSLAPFAYTHPARAVSHALFARLLAAQLGCASADTTQVLQCLQAVDAQVLVNASWNLTHLTAGPNLLMIPRVENVYGFLPDLPLRLMAKGMFTHCNTIRGFTMHEGGFFFNASVLSQINSPMAFMAVVSDSLSQFTIVDKDRLVFDISSYYIYNITTPEPLSYAKAALDFTTDFNFVAPAVNEVQMASKASKGEKHYLYQFSVRPPYSTQPDWVTAVHADDIAFVFGFGIELWNPLLQDISRSMMKMWTNFAKTGNPNCASTSDCVDDSWKTFTQNEQNMLNIRSLGKAFEQFNEPSITGDYFGFMQRIDTAIDPSSNVVG
ncbi:carboxylic ester hydrolase [Elysia marginata]|uniref:Carboxylic ester hydrolase n=1 Tax=Elysia marginata TaxID=1093978 RepID=A0AAV4H686_9GAST|nr:carboxylic ester hydrolase [Elysia marginata]